MLSLSCRPLRLSFSGSGLGQGSTFVTGNLGNSDMVGLEATLRHPASDQLGFSKPNGPGLVCWGAETLTPSCCYRKESCLNLRGWVRENGDPPPPMAKASVAS